VKYFSPRSPKKRRERAYLTSYPWLCISLSTTACPSATPSAAISRLKKKIEAWNVFTGAGEDSPFFHRWADVMADGSKKMVLCWGQAGTYSMEPQTSQGPWPLRAAALSFYWNLWLEALDKGLKYEEGQAWNKFTAQAMAIIPEAVRNDRDILSMIDLLVLRDITPPDQCYHNALLTAFNLQLTCGDTKSSMGERSRRATTLKAIAVAQ
jgi:hypothetical protein